MRITDVSVTLFSWDDIPAVIYSPNVHGAAGSSQLGLVEIHTDAGITGQSFLGASYASATIDAQRLITVLKPLVMGENPLDRELLYRRMWGRNRAASVRAVGAMDVALWDLAGKAAGMPVHQLIGTFRRSLPAYASSPAHSSVEGYCEEALFFQSRGVSAYKIHAPHPWAQDIATCTVVRRAVGDAHVLMLDASWSYDYPVALRVGRVLEELRFHWLEDPLGEWSIPNYVKLRQKLDIPLMATELPFAGFDTYAPWIMAQATDFLRGDVAFKGGITTMLKTAHLAEAFGMNYEIHHGSNSLNNVANLHVAMAIRNCEFFEVLLPDTNNKYGLERDIEIDAGGLVHAPEEPGLGMPIDHALIRRKQVAVLR
ncbi:enolase C-terminal domain-like protein [Roseomonas sp. BN140053]|uniref:enolase C-terminal domain-like protein n=1 Tax=Roseomonas sp. BN140053 TaxID=3391898 RepID=UPI0039EB0E5E